MKSLLITLSLSGGFPAGLDRFFGVKRTESPNSPSWCWCFSWSCSQRETPWSVQPLPGGRYICDLIISACYLTCVLQHNRKLQCKLWGQNTWLRHPVYTHLLTALALDGKECLIFFHWRNKNIVLWSVHDLSLSAVCRWMFSRDHLTQQYLLVLVVILCSSFLNRVVVCICRLFPGEDFMSEMALTGRVRFLQRCVIIHQWTRWQ